MLQLREFYVLCLALHPLGNRGCIIIYGISFEFTSPIHNKVGEVPPLVYHRAKKWSKCDSGFIPLPGHCKFLNTWGIIKYHLNFMNFVLYCFKYLKLLKGKGNIKKSRWKVLVPNFYDETYFICTKTMGNYYYYWAGGDVTTSLYLYLVTI